MTTTTDSGVVDMSGVITSILQSYQNVVTQYQQMVTGDPGALSTAGQTLQDKATTLASASSDLTQRANTLASTWEGDAATAFRNAATGLAGQLDASRATAAQEGQRLVAAAGLLQGAKTQMDSIVSQFQQYSQTLIAESRQAAAGAVGQFVQAAQQLGESAVNAAKSLVDQVGQALAALWQPAAEAAVEGATEAAEREKEFTGKPGQRALANQPWFQQWYRQTFGRDPDPNHLKMGALSWLSKDDVLNGQRRSTSAPGGFVNTGWWSLGANGIQPAGAPLKANTPFGSLDDPPESASTAAKMFHDTNISLYDTGKHVLADGTVYDPKTSGDVNMGAFGNLNGKAEFAVGPELTGQGNISIHNGQLQAGGDLKGTLLDASAGGGYTNGPLAAQGSGDAMVGADLSGHISGGVNGFAAHGNAFAGAQVQGTVSADVAGIGVGATGGLQAGIGAQFDGQLTWANGHIVGNLKAGATLGVGATVGGNIDVDVPKLVNTAEQYGGQVYNSMSEIGTSVENTAGQAANAIGAAFNHAGHSVGAW
jgi:Proteins of 100 residues with WXG